MFNNAKLYNADESQIFTDAAILQVLNSLYSVLIEANFDESV